MTTAEGDLTPLAAGLILWGFLVFVGSIVLWTQHGEIRNPTDHDLRWTLRAQVVVLLLPLSLALIALWAVGRAVWHAPGWIRFVLGGERPR